MGGVWAGQTSVAGKKTAKRNTANGKRMGSAFLVDSKAIKKNRTAEQRLPRAMDFRAIAVSGLLDPEALHSSRPDPKEGRPGTKHIRAYPAYLF